jgi:hypothetical protein
LAAITVAPHATPAATKAVCDEQGAGVPALRIVTLLQAGTSQVDGTCSPVVAVANQLPHDDPESGLRARQRAGNPLPTFSEADADAVQQPSAS